MIIVGMIILGILVLGLVGASLKSIEANSRGENAVFIEGSLPDPALDGQYNGNAQNSSNWQGKRFNASEQSGINRFSDGERYTFATSSARSLSSTKQILKLDYNQPGNPWCLKLIFKEVSQVEPGKYQGKVYIKLGPMFFTLTYFELTRE